MITVFATFTFEAAHSLPHVPIGHKCGRLHGHSWTVEIQATGEPKEPQGWIVDFYDIEKAWFALYALLDHRLLNEVRGLENPTTEVIAAYVFKFMVARVPEVSRVIVRETPSFGAIYPAHPRSPQ